MSLSTHEIQKTFFSEKKGSLESSNLQYVQLDSVSFVMKSRFVGQIPCHLRNGHFLSFIRSSGNNQINTDFRGDLI